jgi:hypothetical protein
MPTLRSLFLLEPELELELEDPLAPEPSDPEPHAATVSAAADITAATFIV